MGAMLLLTQWQSAIAVEESKKNEKHHPREVNLGEVMDDFLKQSEVPSFKDQHWMSVSKGVEYQPSPQSSQDPKMQRTLDRLLRGDDDTVENPYADQTIFVDGAETYYDAYAQAWRYVGFYVDCQAEAEDDRRRLDGDNDGVGCVRYLLWAAYVDPYYGGNGLYEYQFYDRWDEEWVSYCNDDDSCRKMDCHQSGTHYQLMGFFKHADFDDWVEQLFKHEGVCIWTEDESDFMYNMEELLPKGCYQTYTYDEDNNKELLYYGLKPLADGDVTLGLYTDYMCSQLYGGDASVWDLVQNNENRRLSEIKQHKHKHSGRRLSSDDQDLEEVYEAYNSAFSIYKICQPCIAYDLSNYMECDDDAGYTNVNQCMKFRSQCEMGTATMEDVNMALEQGSTTTLSLMNMASSYSDYTKYVNNYISINDDVDDRRERFLFFGATSVLVIGLCSLVRAHVYHREQKRNNASTYKTPLMKNENRS